MATPVDLFVEDIRRRTTSLGFKELRKPEDVDDTIKNSKGTLLIFVNSTCGCTSGIARPAVEMALKGKTVPDSLATVFAGQDKDATAQARTYFTSQLPSSPSFALMKDGQLVRMIHRSDIEGRDPRMVAAMLEGFFQLDRDSSR